MVINVWVRARAAMTDENATKMLAYVLRNAAHIQGWPDVRFYAWDSLWVRRDRLPRLVHLRERPAAQGLVRHHLERNLEGPPEPGQDGIFLMNASHSGW